MSTRIGDSRIVLPDGTEYARHRFEWWDTGRAVVSNDNGLALIEWDGTTLSQQTGRTWMLHSAQGAWLATITKRGG